MTSPIKTSKQHMAGITLVSLLIAAAHTHAQTETTQSQRIDQLEKQVQTLQQRSVSPLVERVRFNGFLSVGYVSADNDAGYGGIPKDYDLEQESLLGLQGTFIISPSTEVIMQLVSRGDERWEPTMEWAYLSHRFSDNFTGRAGKMRMPLFMYSDFLEVGYAQPWARPPIEVYGEVPFASYTGMDGTYDWNLENSTIAAQVYAGQTDIQVETPAETLNFDVRDIMGGSLTWTDFVWTLRGSYSSAKYDFFGEYIPVDFYGYGVGFNNGNWQVVSEITQINIDGATADPQSAYITVAKRFGAFTPYISYALLETQDNDERTMSFLEVATAYQNPTSPLYQNPTAFQNAEVYNAERRAISVGVRWDATTKVALKFDVTKADDFGDTGGGLSVNNPVENPAALDPMTFQRRVIYQDSTIYSIKLDATF